MFNAIQRWWPSNMEEVTALFKQAPIVILWQCPESLAAECRSWIFRQRPYPTPIIDLRQTEEEMWEKLEAKSCRYEVRKGQKLECQMLRNEDTDAARVLINNSIIRQACRPEMSQSEWDNLLPTHDVFLCRWEGVPLVAHVLMRNAPDRVRLLLSGTVDRSDARFHKVIGPLNRRLHWHELLLYKAEGYQKYDFGGSPMEKDSPLYSITQFKLSFGATVVSEPIVYVAKNPLLRVILIGVGAVHGGLRAIPWPKGLLKAVKTNPLFAFFRH